MEVLSDYPLVGCQVATRHGEELPVREQERAKQIRRLLPYPTLSQVSDENAAMIHRVRKVEFWLRLPENVSQNRRCGDLSNFMRMELAASARKCGL